MKIAVSVPYWPTQFHTIQTNEKTTSGSAPYARLRTTVDQALSSHPLCAIKFFILSLARAILLVAMAIIKALSAILFVVEILFSSTMAKIDNL